MLRITDCRDGMLWYADKVGHLVDFVRYCDEGYLSREPSGHTNIVRAGDAELLEVSVLEPAIPKGPLRVVLEVDLPDAPAAVVNRVRQQLCRAIEGYDFSHTAKCTFVLLP